MLRASHLIDCRSHPDPLRFDSIPNYACRSNTGVVDIYTHDGTGGNCRLLKALVPPQRSRHTNVKLTCVKLGPRDRMLAMGNILGAVNVILLDFGEGAGGAKKAQRISHSHSHHEVYGGGGRTGLGIGKTESAARMLTNPTPK